MERLANGATREGWSDAGRLTPKRWRATAAATAKPWTSTRALRCDGLHVGHGMLKWKTAMPALGSGAPRPTAAPKFRNRQKNKQTQKQTKQHVIGIM